MLSNVFQKWFLEMTLRNDSQICSKVTCFLVFFSNHISSVDVLDVKVSVCSTHH